MEEYQITELSDVSEGTARGSSEKPKDKCNDIRK